MPRSSSRSWSSRGSHSESSSETESSAHSVVPLNPRTTPVAYSCASIVMSLTVKTSPSKPSRSMRKRSPVTGVVQRTPAVRSALARSEEIIR